MWLHYISVVSSLRVNCWASHHHWHWWWWCPSDYVIVKLIKMTCHAEVSLIKTLPHCYSPRETNRKKTFHWRLKIHQDCHHPWQYRSNILNLILYFAGILLWWFTNYNCLMLLLTRLDLPFLFQLEMRISPDYVLWPASPLSIGVGWNNIDWSNQSLFLPNYFITSDIHQIPPTVDVEWFRRWILFPVVSHTSEVMTSVDVTCHYLPPLCSSYQASQSPLINNVPNRKLTQNLKGLNLLPQVLW